jgi:hypothetical protein
MEAYSLRNAIGPYLLCCALLVLSRSSAFAGAPEPAGAAPTAAEDISAPPSDAISRPTGTLNAPVQPLVSAPATTVPEEDNRGFTDRMHSALSDRLLSTATRLDHFFTNESYLKEENKSYVRFRYDIFKEEQAKLSYKPSFDVRLALPALERKTRIDFSAESAENRANAASPVRTAGERFGTTSESNFTTALQFIFRSTPEESFVVRSGIQLVKSSPAAFAAPRYRILFPYDPWQLRLTQEVLYNTRTNWQTDSRIELERILPHDFFFRATTDGVWTAENYDFAYSVSFLLREPLDSSRAIEYAWINNFDTQPLNELIETAVRVAYRQNFLRSWLFYEISPQVRFPRSTGFDARPGILFRIDMLFGAGA